VLLFVVAVTLHARLYETRPDPARLTQFYLVMSAGGVLGGLFTALIAPLVFDWTWEHPLLILAAAALLPLRSGTGWLGRIFTRPETFRIAIILMVFLVFTGAAGVLREMQTSPAWSLTDVALFAALITAAMLLTARRWAFVAACAALIASLGALTQAQTSLAGARSRSYFGIYTVKDTSDGYRQLLHGTTLHGAQKLTPGEEMTSTTYYGPRSGVGLALSASERLFGNNARIGVVGLGVGTLACYSKPGQEWTFFEIDPEVLAYSTRGEFSFLDRCAPKAPTIIGDARLQLERLPADNFDILVVDAFSSDAIPLHLLTAEAQRVYFRALAADGVLMIHISNRFIDLEPVLAALARDGGLAATIRVDRPDNIARSSSKWVALSRDPAQLRALEQGDEWRPLAPASPSVWRDDYASILPHLIWNNFL
jgi:SAM-dependent methyltransferase